MTDRPVISTNWLLEEADQEVAVQAMKRVCAIGANMREVITGLELYPGDDVISDQQILASIRAHVSAVHHGTSTCAMEKAGDPVVFVDSHGKVFGVSSLRVIDASSFPFTPPRHTQAAIYAHAEKLAYDIMSQKD